MFGFLIYILCSSIIFSYGCSTDKSKKTTNTEKSDSKEIRLINFIRQFDIPINGTILILQPSKCLSCQPKILNIINTIDDLYILHSKTEKCMSDNPNHKCISYNQDILLDAGLSQLYSEIIIIKEGKIIEKTPLFK